MAILNVFAGVEGHDPAERGGKTRGHHSIGRDVKLLRTTLLLSAGACSFAGMPGSGGSVIDDVQV